MMEIRRGILLNDGLFMPPGYQRIEWLESDGTPYIDSGIECTSDLIVEFDYMWISRSSTNTGICGGMSSANSPMILRHTCNPYYGYYMMYASSTSGRIAVFAVANNTRCVCMVNPVTGLAKINGTSAVFTPVPSGYTTGKGYGIFARINENGEKFSNIQSRFYSVKFYRNGKQIGNFVPCIRKSDSTPGMYNTIAHDFRTNAGTGTFTVPV